jgi:hypothetical protein
MTIVEDDDRFLFQRIDLQIFWYTPIWYSISAQDAFNIQSSGKSFLILQQFLKQDTDGHARDFGMTSVTVFA